MATVIFRLCTNSYINNIIANEKGETLSPECKTYRKILTGIATIDCIAITTLLVLAILGAHSVIALPTAASYAMIGTAFAGILALTTLATITCYDTRSKQP